jgi:hypothetical protein
VALLGYRQGQSVSPLVAHSALLSERFSRKELSTNQRTNAASRIIRQMDRVTVVLFLTIGVTLGACGGDPYDSQNLECARQAQNGMRWGYYPGYGCGPVPPAQTKFS